MNHYMLLKLNIQLRTKNATQQQNREERYTALLNIYNEEVKNPRKKILIDYNGLQLVAFNGLQIGDIDKKVKSQFYLALSKERQKWFACKNPGKKIQDISFAEIWQLLKTTFTSGTYLTYERFKLVSRQQKGNENL